MRLIDADTLIKNLSYLYAKNHIPVDMRAKEILTTIMEQPTAYDINKVVEDLKKIKGSACEGSSCSKCKYKSICMESEQSKKVAIDEAIEIVKQGGDADDVCEWKKSNDTAINPHTSVEFRIKQCAGLYKLNTCPYCDKKIKVVE